jgi:hypothetical protein
MRVYGPGIERAANRTAPAACVDQILPDRWKSG